MSRKLFVIALFFIMVISCKVKPKVVRPTDRYLVDSLYTMKIDSVREGIDSICLSLQGEFFDRAVDSIIRERIKEIESLQN